MASKNTCAVRAGRWIITAERNETTPPSAGLAGLRIHSTPVCCTKASWKLRAKFHGKTAHAAAGPWTGRNACDAIVQAYNGIALLRQHIQKSEVLRSQTGSVHLTHPRLLVVVQDHLEPLDV